MPLLEVLPFTPNLLPDAAALLAERHQADRSREPALPERFEDRSSCLERLESVLPKLTGVAAMREGRPAGYLLCETDPMHHPQRRAFVPLEGHAIASDEDGETYRQMYAVLAASLVRAGVFNHQVLIPTKDEVGASAWFSLTFGQRLHIAGRGLEAVKGDAEGFDIRLGGPEDEEAVWKLFVGLGHYNTSSPLFVPDIYDDAGWRRSVGEDLADAANAFWLAYEVGVPVAVMHIRPTREMEFDRPPGTANLSIAFARKSARHSGIGSALLRRCVAWARENGYQRIALDFFTYNLTATRFWLGHGFEPVATIMQRRIDARVMWADGAEP